MAKRFLDKYRPCAANTYAIPAFSAAIALIVFLPAIFNDFVDFDDNIYIYANPGLRPLSIDFIKWAFHSTLNASWQPVTWLSYGIDYTIWGMNPMGFHLGNVLIHAANAFLLTLLVLRLTEAASVGTGDRGILIPLFVGAVFATHPLQAEPVAWVSERKGVLSAFFYLLSALSYVKFAMPGARRKPAYYLASMLALALALMSKPIAVTAPAVFLVLDFYPLKRLGMSSAIMRMAEKVPFAALSAGSIMGTFYVHDKWQALGMNEMLTLGERVMVSARALVFYLYKLVAPFGLQPFYLFDYASFDPRSPEHLASLAIVLTVTIAAIWLCRRQPVLLAAWAIYVITISPVIGIVQFGEHSEANRYMYLPHAAPASLAGAMIAMACKRWAFVRKLMPALLIMLLASSSFLTYNQIGVWRDSVSLWQYNLRFNPANYNAHNGLATAYFNKGDYEKAVEHYTSAIRLNMLMADAYHARGFAWLRLKQYDKAIKDLKTHISIGNTGAMSGFGPAVSYLLLGDVYTALGKNSEAIRNYRMAVLHDPSLVEAVEKLAEAYAAAGDYANAIVQMREAARLSPSDREIQKRVGELETMAGSKEESTGDAP